MTTTRTNPVLGYIRHLAACGSVVELPDATLLERFVRRREEAAFAALLRRHGPMVLGICRRVLRDDHAAEDAFQATFLVLARKAGSLKQPGSLGPWLHGVALRTARRARTDAARRRARETKAAIEPAVEAEEELVWRDMRPVLDEAVATLGEKYRVPLIRCYLEGETVAEVARQLGCKKGTIAMRLARARECLRTRLSRRGVTLSTGALAAALAESKVSAVLPVPLAERTVATATSAALYPAAADLVSADVASLSKGVLQAMSKTKIKMAVCLLLFVTLGSGGIALIARPAPADHPSLDEDRDRKAAAPAAEIKRQQRIFHVTALVVLPDGRPAAGQRTKTDTTAADKLIQLIQEAIAPASWAGRGGKGTIDYHPLNMALVVNQTPEIQDQIAEFLDFLGRLDETDRHGQFRFIMLTTKEGRSILRRYVQAMKGNRQRGGNDSRPQ